MVRGIQRYVNTHYFDDESKNMYYVLGALFPCYTATDYRTKGIIIRSGKKELVEIVKRELSSEHAIVSDNRVGRSSHWIEISDINLRNVFEQLGLDPDKAKRRFPKDIKECYLDHFIRGFIDSKAEVGKNANGSNHIWIYFNQSFLAEFDLTLQRYAGVKRREGPRGRLGYNHDNSIKIHDFIYQDWEFIKESGLYLPSQKNRFNPSYKAAVRPTVHKSTIEKVEKIKSLLLSGWSVNNSIEEIGLNKAWTYRVFKKVTGKTPGQFIKENYVGDITHN